MEAVQNHLLFRPMLPDDDKAAILFSGNAYVRQLGNDPTNYTIDRNPEGQHLGCFVGGMFGLGGKLFGITEHVALGEQLAAGCAWAYAAFPTGVMPEIFGMVPCAGPPTVDSRCAWDEAAWQAEGSKTLRKGFSHARDTRYILRPEAIESIFLTYRMTGKREYQEMAWTMFQAIQNLTRTQYANSAVLDVTAPAKDAVMLDSMEVSFHLVTHADTGHKADFSDA
jgi:mannosyl-oligosaccharide alpha-1,2-mannosidase